MKDVVWSKEKRSALKKKGGGLFDSIGSIGYVDGRIEKPCRYIISEMQNGGIPDDVLKWVFCCNGFMYSSIFKKFPNYFKEKPDLCLEACKHQGFVLEYIKNPTEEMCLEAFNQNPDSIKYIKNFSGILLNISSKPTVLEYSSKPCIEEFKLSKNQLDIFNSILRNIKKLVSGIDSSVDYFLLYEDVGNIYI